MASGPIQHATATLPFDAFWSWLQAHPNCIIRAGTPEAVLYDDDDLHWHFSAEGPDTFLVQLQRGKKLVGEMMVIVGAGVCTVSLNTVPQPPKPPTAVQGPPALVVPNAPALAVP